MELVYKRRIWGYECDLNGHLNNAQYLQLFEEARTEAMREIGLSVEDFRRLGMQIVLTRAEVEYKLPVAYDDLITLRTRILAANRLRSTWEQRIFNEQGELCSRALVEGVFLKAGKPHRMTHEQMAVFAPYIMLEEG